MLVVAEAIAATTVEDLEDLLLEIPYADGTDFGNIWRPAPRPETGGAITAASPAASSEQDLPLFFGDGLLVLLLDFSHQGLLAPFEFLSTTFGIAD